MNPTGFALVKWAGASAGAVSIAALVVLFVLAGDPERLGRAMTRLEQVLPSTLAGLIARSRREVRARPRRDSASGPSARRARVVVPALAVDRARHLVGGAWRSSFAIPFTGSFLLIALLTLGVAVPTPGAVGGFHEAFRVGATMFYGAPDDAAVGAAIVLHLFSIGPSLLLGLFFAAQEGLNLGSMQRLADQAEQGHTA